MANTYKHRHKITVTTEWETLQSVEKEYTGDGKISLRPTIPASSTNFSVTPFAFAIANVKSIWLKCNKAATLKTNDSGTPQDTIALAAGVPKVWNADMTSGENPFSADITALFVTMADTAAAELELDIILDATPSTP